MTAERTRSPVAMFVFARPDTTARVLDAVRRARPSRLLVIGEAPRRGDAEEEDRCAQVRGLIETVDWDCEVSTDYAPEHLSMRERFETGLGWVFSEVPEAIVLEDDCVPDPSFFHFCDALLERYRDDERVMSIGGTNIQPDTPTGPDSYYFSRYPAIWGWASWSRAWDSHDPGMTAWPELRDGGWVEREFSDPRAVGYWRHQFEQTFRGDEAWDRAFLFAALAAGRLHAIPSVNLVSNVGFRADATHTGPEQRGAMSHLQTSPMELPLRHPAEMRRNAEADAVTERVAFSGVLDQLFDRLRTKVQAGQGRG